MPEPPARIIPLRAKTLSGQNVGWSIQDYNGGIIDLGNIKNTPIPLTRLIITGKPAQLQGNLLLTQPGFKADQYQAGNLLVLSS